MLTTRNMTFHEPSASAERTFRRLRQANIVVYVLIGLIVLCAIWNVITVADMIRGVSTPDLADVGSIRTHISARLVTILSIVTLAVFAFKEWKWGERSFTMFFLLTPLLFLFLVPVMASEVEPTEEAMGLEFSINLCRPGGIEGGELMDRSLCDIAPLEEGQVFLATSNPMDGDTEWIAPEGLTDRQARWNVVGRGEFVVYYLFAQNSMEQCETARTTTSVSPHERRGYQCLEQDGQAWLVQPFVTSALKTGWLVLYQEVVP